MRPAGIIIPCLALLLPFASVSQAHAAQHCKALVCMLEVTVSLEALTAAQLGFDGDHSCM